ncbi:MAG: DNA gyrase subunit A [Magnetospirillum sp.]|nr:DNA gyrase subunit A [Magnetospirillum sp.]
MTDTAQPNTPGPIDVSPVSIEEEMKRSYLDYAMSVIVSRALPDARDGLKPVHRRILFAMQEAGYDWNRPYRKSARVVGDVMGKYHPHGDSAIYESMVRMAQDFSMRLMLIDGQGNFGSMDGDPPAAMRYTEARLAKVASLMLADLERDTVDFQPNYDDSAQEPTVVPAVFPNLLVNGAAGIAVGMATSIPTHNLGEVIDACCAYIDDPEISLDALMVHVPGPDFPTGGIVLGRGGLREAYRTGRGSILLRGRAHVEEIRKDREAIVVTEIPYQQNKAQLLERIAECVNEKIIEGISDLRDESDRDGVRVVIELKRDANSEIVLNQLYKYTGLQKSVGFNMLALNRGKPELMGLKELVRAFVEFREEVITRRTRFELREARKRAHLLIGLAVSVVNLDPVIELIRKAPDPVVARERLMERAWPVGEIASYIELVGEPGRGIVDGTYRLSEEQARAILELRLQRLTGLERDKILGELKDIVARIADYLDILASRTRLYGILKSELLAIRTEFADKRRTTLEEGDGEQDIEDLIAPEDMVVTVTHAGYIKRTPLSAYRAQRRGGKGRAGMATREEDFVSQVFVANTHDPVLFFTTRGLAFRLKCHRLPLGTPQARGKPMVQLLPLADGEKIATVLPLPRDEALWDNLHIMFATSAGNVRRNALSDFRSIMVKGKIAMKLEEAGERLVAVQPCTERQDVVLATRQGKCIRFAVEDVRVFQSRNSTGVRGQKLAEGDEVISMAMIRHMDLDTAEREAYLKMARARRGAAEDAGDAAPADAEAANVPAVTLSEDRFAELAAAEEFLLAITSKGYGKRSSSYEYRLTNRGGSGIANIETTDKNGEVVASFPVADGDQLMIVSDGGTLIRTPVDDIRIARRQTQGVTVFRVGEGERVVSVARLGDLGGEEPAGDGSGAGEGTGGGGGK